MVRCSALASTKCRLSMVLPCRHFQVLFFAFSCWTVAAEPKPSADGDRKPQAAECDASGDPRACAAGELLRTLTESGASAGSAKLSVRADGKGGHGIFVDAPVKQGATVFALPRELWLTGYSRFGLPLELGRAMRQADSSRSAPHVSAYVKTLPRSCPPNLAARPQADRRAVAASEHSWIVDILEEDEAELSKGMPDANATERRLWTCLKMSRALNDLTVLHEESSTYPAVLLPFVDLINHDLERTVREHWNEQGLVLTAARDLLAGDELVFPYKEHGSPALMLIGFGFRPKEWPAYTLGVNGVVAPPESDAELLKKEVGSMEGD